MSTATLNRPAAPTRPNLQVELEARRDCRHNLIGMTVQHGKRLRIIFDSEWRIGAELWVCLGQWGRDREMVPASDVTLCGAWRCSCCRSRLDAYGMPKRRKEVAR